MTLSITDTHFSVTSSVALVTGGGVGTGKAIALGLARAGSDVAINYSRSATEAEETVEEIRKLGRNAVAVQCDVSEDAAVREMVAKTVQER